MKEPGHIDRGHRGIVVECVLREGLADEDAGVIDQTIDPPVAIQRVLYNTLGSVDVRDVTPNGEKAGRVRGRHRTRGSHDGVPGSAVRGHQACANTLRGARDNSDFLRSGQRLSRRRLRSHPTR